ncbi:MAG: hypothetical protein LBR98_05495 [Syntrophomonadaceae bacterium]|nr:hypothetical protein [Syntrophomonadaceae bacterium]
MEALHEQGLSPAQIGEILYPKRDRRTIARKLLLGLAEQKGRTPATRNTGRREARHGTGDSSACGTQDAKIAVRPGEEQDAAGKHFA